MSTRGFRLSTGSTWTIRGLVVVVLAFIYVPLGVVVLNSFNADRTFAWPPSGLTLEWWRRASRSSGLIDSLQQSVVVGLAATGVALLLGSLAAFALQRYEFFGRQAVSLLIVLPIALPGIVTAIALSNVFTTILGVGVSVWSLVIAHATFCIVVVFNNVVARLRRLGGNIDEASMDLGATRWTTFRLVTLPNLGTALLAGGLLAFALSFDEIVVSTFTAPPDVQTLPLWIYSNLLNRQQAPVVNVAAAGLIVLSIVPIYLSQRLSGERSGGRL
ncbi:MAG: ABC transporter permease [Propionibacteriales bacterium]|nr:ABC transporter permease [Propionibacteriales bacterium]